MAHAINIKSINIDLIKIFLMVQLNIKKKNKTKPNCNEIQSNRVSNISSYLKKIDESGVQVIELK